MSFHNIIFIKLKRSHDNHNIISKLEFENLLSNFLGFRDENRYLNKNINRCKRILKQKVCNEITADDPKKN